MFASERVVVRRGSEILDIIVGRVWTLGLRFALMVTLRRCLPEDCTYKALESFLESDPINHIVTINDRLARPYPFSKSLLSLHHFDEYNPTRSHSSPR